jgi:hypothetical protein
VKHSILRSFEALIKGLDPAPEEPEAPQEPPKPAPRPKPRILVEEGVFLGRAWRRYADGGVEGETVRGMAAFRDLESFQSFVRTRRCFGASALPKIPRKDRTSRYLWKSLKASQRVQSTSRQRLSTRPRPHRRHLLDRIGQAACARADDRRSARFRGMRDLVAPLLLARRRACRAFKTRIERGRDSVRQSVRPTFLVLFPSQ